MRPAAAGTLRGRAGEGSGPRFSIAPTYDCGSSLLAGSTTPLHYRLTLRIRRRQYKWLPYRPSRGTLVIRVNALITLPRRIGGTLWCAAAFGGSATRSSILKFMRVSFRNSWLRGAPSAMPPTPGRELQRGYKSTPRKRRWENAAAFGGMTALPTIIAVSQSIHPTLRGSITVQSDESSDESLFW